MVNYKPKIALPEIARLPLLQTYRQVWPYVTFGEYQTPWMIQTE